MKKNVAIIGCGNISEIYLKNLTERFDNVNVYAVCDIDEQKAREKSEKYNVKVMDYDQILRDEHVDIVLNLTVPGQHYEICKRAIEAGKSIYVEKPLSITYKEGADLVSQAKRKQVLIGCAPDTFMGAGIQTARTIIENNLIGDIVGGSAFMVCAGHERWHPSPEFYYRLGGGPLFDMGPYYITALVCLIGGVSRVVGMGNRIRKTRTITSEPQKGTKINVEVDTHINALLEFENGAIVNMMMSFDVFGSHLPRIEIYGTKGSIIVPDPNGFGGEVLLKQSFDKEFHAFPLINPFSENCRGLGVSDMANCLVKPIHEPCASGATALHVLEIMEKILQSNEQKQGLTLETKIKTSRMD